jgi:hypothetical protein
MTGQAHDPVRDDSFAAQRRAAGDGKVKRLFERAKKGDREAVFALRDLLADDPDRFVALGRGDLAEMAIDTIAFVVANPKWRDRGGEVNGLRWAAVATKARQLLAELCPPGADSVVERLLAQRVAITWITANYLEMDGVSHGVHDERWDRLAHRAASRHVQPLKALAAVRRLDLGPLRLQVNVAGAQQVVNEAPAPAAVAGEDPGKPRPKQGRRALPG